MCRFKSGIILKNMVRIAEGSDDSHKKLLNEMGLTDDYIGASKVFVRAELVPEESEWWIDPKEYPEKWRFIVDQDITPEWFDMESCEKRFREAVQEWWKLHILVDKQIDELVSGYYRLKNCKVNRLLGDAEVEMYGSSTVQRMYGSSTVQRMYGSSTVQDMHDSSTVQRMYDSSTVQEMYDSSTVQEMHDSSTVQEMYDSSTVQRMYDSSTVQEMHDSSTVQEMYDSSTVQEMYDSSTVQRMYGSSTVQEMHDSSTVQEMYDSSTVQEMYDSSTVQEMYENAVARSFKQYAKTQILIPDSTKNIEVVRI